MTARIGVLVATIMAISAGAWYWVEKSEYGRSGTMQIAVLPFAASSGTPDDVAFGRRIAENLAGDLASIGPGIRVVQENEVTQNHVAHPHELKRVFGVDRAFTGELERLAGAQTRLTIHLVDAGSDKVVASKTVVSAGPDLGSDAFRGAKALLGFSEDSPSAPRTASDYYERGVHFLERYDKSGYIGYAIAAFMRAEQVDPSYARAYAGLANAYWREYLYAHERQDMNRAREQANEALARNEKLAIPHIVLGAIAVHLGQIDEGMKQLRQAIDLDPVSADAYREMGNAYASAGNALEAERYFNRAIQNFPDWVNYNALGIFYNRQARYAEAERALRKADELSSDNDIVYRNLGGVEMALGQWDAAKDSFDKAIRLQPRGSDFSNLGTLFIYTGQYGRAIPVLEKALAFAGSNRSEIPILCTMGDAYSLNGQRRQALDSWAKAIALANAELGANPNNAALESLLAAYEAKAGQLESARTHVTDLRRRFPKDHDVLFAAVLVAELDHRRRDALMALRSALENGYSLSLVQREPELASLRSDPAYAMIEARAKERK
jgi:tetratricopeptide (TPR) repeat protein/TolB-like protein